MTLALELVFALILLAALSAAASAVRSVSRIWLRHWAEAHPESATSAESPGDRRERLLAAALAGSAAVAGGAGIALAADRGTEGWTLIGEIVLLGLLLLLLGELVPRSIARRWAGRVMPIVLPPLRVVELLLDPVLRLARLLARPLARRAPIAESLADEELHDLLREGEREGIGEREEIAIISGLVQLQRKAVRDVMTPRTDIFALPESLPPREMAEQVARSGYSRVPVYRESLDEIVGMVHVIDLMKAGASRTPPIRLVAQAPASKPCSEMLVEMLRAQRHLAIVLDEFGGTAGVVTLEDMLEEMVGEIRDEHDEPAGEAAWTGERALVVDGSTELAALRERFGIDLPGGERSIGGLLVRALGRIPTVGERFRVGELEIVIVEAERERVRRVLVQRASASVPMTLTPAD